MKIGLINENSQAGKNSIIYNELKLIADQKGYEVLNFGMFDSEEESQLTYVQIGLLTSILLNAKVVDFVVTGCGTGQGAMLSCNSFPGVECGHVTNPLDAYLFAQVNGGNAIAMPFAQEFGWGGEINLRYTFEKLFSEDFGKGYPRERAIPEQRNARILKEVKQITHNDLIDILKKLDKEFLFETINRKSFEEVIKKHNGENEILNYLQTFFKE